MDVFVRATPIFCARFTSLRFKGVICGPLISFIIFFNVFLIFCLSSFFYYICCYCYYLKYTAPKPGQFFLSAIWLPNGQLWTIIEGTASLTRY